MARERAAHASATALAGDTTRATLGTSLDAEAARAASGWRVLHHDTGPRVSATLALNYFYLDEQTREQIAGDAQIDWTHSSLPIFTSPAALTQLPASVRDSLGARGCTVLQTRGHTTTNVVRGAFFSPAEGDWAVLCIVGRSATILVFPRDGGAPASLQTVGGEVPDLTHPPTCPPRARHMVAPPESSALRLP